MQRVCYRWSWSRTAGWMRPVASGERKSELLELPDGCNALFVDGAHGLFRRDGHCDTISASAELPRPTTLTDKCSDRRPRQHKNDGRATDFIELSQNMPDGVRDQHAFFHFQNEQRGHGAKDSHGVGGTAAIVGARPVEHDGRDARSEGAVSDPDHSALPIKLRAFTPIHCGDNCTLITSLWCCSALLTAVTNASLSLSWRSSRADLARHSPVSSS